MGDFFYYGIFINMNLQENIQRIQEMMGLNEKLGDIYGTPLYHITSTNRGLKIIDLDKIIAGNTDNWHLAFDKRLINSDKQKAISFTRNKNWKPKNKNSIGVGVGPMEDLDMVFVLDREKLKTRYDVEPFNYSGLGSEDSNFLRSNQNEFEERVLTDEISPLRKYLLDIIYTGNDPEIKEIINTYLNR